MIGIPEYPKIFSIGHREILDLFNEEVEVTEKYDGSLFGFGKINNELHCRSKNVQIDLEHPPKMFELAVERILSKQTKILNNTTYYAEYLNKPKHNVLSYGRVPHNNLALFGVKMGDEFLSNYDELQYHAELLDIEPVRLLYKGVVKDEEDLFKFMELESLLGGCKIEGIVCKNYSRSFLLSGKGQYFPIMCGKFVSEQFKERNNAEWKKNKANRAVLQAHAEGFRTEARWNKSIQHLKEQGKLLNEPKDIGILIKEIQHDIVEEEKENIKDFLWSHFSGSILRLAIKGFPEYYKERLLKNSFKE